MFLIVLCVLIIVGGTIPEACARVQDYAEYEDDDIGNDFYGKYSPDISDSVRSFGWSPQTDPLQRVRRFEDRSNGARTLSPEELQEVRGALKQILSGQKIDSLFISPTRDSEDSEEIARNETHQTTEIVDGKTTFVATFKYITEGEEAAHKREKIDEYIVRIEKPTRWKPPRSSVENLRTGTVVFTLRGVDQDYYNYEDLRRQGGEGSGDGGNQDKVTTIAANTTPEITTTTTTTSTTTWPRLDIPALLDIIANLTYIYETNLTSWVNESLQKYSIPTCATPTTTTTTTTEPSTTYAYDYDANGTGVIMGKCYVCGLEVEEIPRTAYCADAFAGDFLPLVPVNPVARGQIGTYRKYCRYMDVAHYHLNQSDPRSLWGRWTGGCSVRWIDLSSVYTQRSCRNRHKAILGKHFVSKRMAKLEMALTHVDNGCVISPAASLVPLSRGISLYARFHACVCSSSWCNRAARVHLSWCTALVTLIAAVVISATYC